MGSESRRRDSGARRKTAISDGTGCVKEISFFLRNFARARHFRTLSVKKTL
jgi:hypothetical protein